MKRQILMFSVLMMTLGSHAVNVSIKMNSVSTSMILVEKSTADTIHVDAPDKSFTYQLDLEPATYTLTGVNKNGTTLQGTMELTVTDEAEQSFIIWTVQTIKATNSGWVYGEDYTIEELSCRTREGKTIPVTLGDGTAAGTKACLILNGGSFNCTLRPSAAHQAEGYVDAYASATVTGNTSSSSAIPMSGMFTVDFPADAHCMVFRKLGGTLGSGSIHYVPFVPITPADSVSGRQTFRLAEGGTYSYRLWKEGKRTKAGTFVFYQGSAYDGKMWDETCDGFNHIVFTDDDLSESSKYFNHSTADNNKSNVANILLNINERGHLRMKSGQTKNLLAQRDWQLTNSQTANYFIEPDYHYTVLDMDGNPGSDIISIDNADTSISPWATLHANKAGSAIVLVTYDAMHLTQWARSGSGSEAKPYTIKESDFCFGADWSACWGENTGVFVVTVDDSETTVQPNMTINEAYNAETMKNAGKYVDAEHDCFYYLNGEDGYHYTFAPVDAASVAIAYPQLTDLTASYSGFTPVEANTDGSYTLILKHGRQIVRITGNDGGIVYQVLTAKECTRTISNLTHDDGKFYPGDEIEIQYDGLFHPANKMSGIYNMSAYITYNGVPTGTELILGSNQYAFGGTPKAQCVKTTIPDTWESGTSFTLDDGVIQVTGFGDPIGNHRFIDKVAGRSPNFTAIAHKTYFGSIPDVKIEISAPGTPTPELLPTTDLSEYDYALYFPETEVNTDVEVAIPLNLKNAEENITAFQCDIYLPEGVKWASSIDKRGNEILTQPTFNADADRTDANYHTITPVTKMSNGAYRVMCYSMNKEIFLDNDGAVLDIPVVIPEDMEDGDYNLIIKDIIITDTDTEQHEVEEVVSKLTVVGYTLGDPNADGLINITDIVSVISYILEEAPADFNFKAADVNGDGIINITDIVGIIDIILSDEAPASARRIRRPAFGSAPAGLTSLEIVPFGIDAGTTSATVTLDLLNPDDEFTAFECDIVLPDGIDWEYTTDRRGNIIYTQPTFNADADRTDANYHTLSNIKKMEDGSFKVMCYSMAKETFQDEAGAILNLPLTFSPELAEGIYEIEVANTVLTRTDVTDKKIGSYRASVVVGTPDAKSAVIYGDVNATAVAMINERLAGCGTLDLRGALAVDGSTAFTLNDNAVIFVADGMSIKNEKNVVEDGTCAVLTLTDGVAFTPSESFTAESASYGRTLGKDEYGTLVLPFEPDAATKAAYAFYELSEADGSTLAFDETTAPEAGTPYVIVSKDAAATFAGSGTIAVTAGDATADGWTMKGTYETLVFTDATELASLYCLSGNQFKQAKSKLTMNPFRAYFQGSGTVGSITLRGNDGTTRILSETLEPSGDCYDLTGRRVLNAEKGVYIVNGKKVLK